METLKLWGSVPRCVQLLNCLNVENLYRLDVDDKIWLDIIEDKGEDGPPLWMSDDGVRESIAALLECDQVMEECECLDAEERTLKQWLREEIDRTMAAKLHMSGMSFRRLEMCLNNH
ncbi:hypothetical protein M422DRAFT_168073 [Sphaerobolus stellatus SS14]|uniref:Uncharacterized protein n=1 Tax=Sphaerobolus stellatus (strain SS14) TaxID=990650 RepID=A0A0C9UNA6_SPHS4|nr:hypothetical protein M422DRAFT_168073 [Sphaerobolus stellatus SS14]